MRPAARAVVALLISSPLVGCGVPPWLLGQPVDGRPSITPGSAKLTVGERHAMAGSQRAAGHVVRELDALLALDQAARLTRLEQDRLVALLELRAADFHARGRAIPESRDLRLLERLAPESGEALAGRRAFAERDAGDAWLGIGALAEAADAYQRAARLGASRIAFRQRVAAGEPTPSSVPMPEIEAEIATLPLRGVPTLALAYVMRGGSDRATLLRGLDAAAQERMPALIARLRNVLAKVSAPPPPPATPAPSEPASPPAAPAAPPTAEPAPVTSAPPPAAPAAAVAEAPPPPPRSVLPPPRSVPPPPRSVPPLPANLDDWLFGGPTLSGRLLPLTAAHPELLEDPRAVSWVDLLLGEDPTSPDVLELAALVFGRARRFGGTERMLMELAYHTPDRAAGLARGAEVWQSLGRSREACAEWIRAARWRDDAEDPTWRRAITCTKEDPGAGDWRAIRKYVLDLAGPERRDAIAAALDGS